jgi:hypothetical protein
MTNEELTKLLIESYDRGVEDAKQEALAALEKTVAVMVAAQLAQRELVGWWDDKLGFFAEKHFDQLQPIYKFPPQRTWVGLTDAQNTVIWANSQSVDEAIRATEKQLMENNI